MPPVQKLSRSTRIGFAAVAGFALVASLGVGTLYWAERARLSVWASKTERILKPPPTRVVYNEEGVKTPPTRPAAESTLDDDAEVVGVEVNGKARAYDLWTMSGTKRHIVNDVVGGKAVTITYCDKAECTRAFSDGNRVEPLDVAQGGLLNGRMVLRIGGVTYLQETGAVVEPEKGHTPAPFPYATYPLVRTTWGKWKSKHPDTDLFASDDPARSGNRPAVPSASP